MNDEFLYRIRTEPAEHFAARLKDRLDSAPRRRARAWYFGLGALLIGTAFAVTFLASRAVDTEVQVVETAAAPTPSVLPSIPEPRTEPPRSAPAGQLAPARPVESKPAPFPLEDERPKRDGREISHAIVLAARGLEILDDDVFPRRTPAWPVAQDDTEARTAIAARHALFRVIASNFEPVEAITRRRRELDRDLVALSAYRLLRLSTMIDDAYALDTRRWSELEGVYSVVWNRTGVFRKAIEEFSVASRALLESAAYGNETEIWRDAARVSRSCIRCHDEFATRRDLPPRP